MSDVQVQKPRVDARLQESACVETTHEGPGGGRGVEVDALGGRASLGEKQRVDGARRRRRRGRREKRTLVGRQLAVQVEQRVKVAGQRGSEQRRKGDHVEVLRADGERHKRHQRCRILGAVVGFWEIVVAGDRCLRLSWFRVSFPVAFCEKKREGCMCRVVVRKS
jgi:hypothetical protein